MKLIGGRMPNFGFDAGTKNFNMCGPDGIVTFEIPESDNGSGKLLTSCHVPAVVAYENCKETAVAWDAYRKIGRTKEHERILRPIFSGCTENEDVLEVLLRFMITAVRPSYFRELTNPVNRWMSENDLPTIVIAVPCNAENVHLHAIQNVVVHKLHARLILVLQPVCDAISATLRMGGDTRVEKRSCTVVNIGGGTTDIASVWNWEAVENGTASTPIGGDVFDQIIIEKMAEVHHLKISVRTAEWIKIKLASTLMSPTLEDQEVMGKHLDTDKRTPVKLTSREVSSWVMPKFVEMAGEIRLALDHISSPQTHTDIQKNGVKLAGQGAKTEGMPEFLSRMLKEKVTLIEEQDPGLSVIQGVDWMLQPQNKWLLDCSTIKITRFAELV